MPSKIVCFWLEPTTQVQVSFRRYARDGAPPCPSVSAPYPGHPPVAWGYHTAEVNIEITERLESEGKYDHHPTVTDDEKLDPRWPTTCACEYVFQPKDPWQHNRHAIYLRVGTEERYTIGNAPAGAMYHAWWMGDHHNSRRTSDGRNIVLKTPEGDWWIDGPANNGPGWTRTGEPPNITCNPSIGIGTPQRLHGWLRNGVLEIDFP